VALVVLGEEHFTLEAEFVVDDARNPEFLFEPDRHRLAERRKRARKRREISNQDSLELHERLVVKRHVIDVVDRKPGLLQAVPHGLNRNVGIVALAGKSFLVRGGDQFAIAEQGRCSVVIEA